MITEVNKSKICSVGQQVRDDIPVGAQRSSDLEPGKSQCCSKIQRQYAREFSLEGGWGREKK